MKKAFYYMFKDNKFRIKALYYFIIAFAVDYLLKIAGIYINNEINIQYGICAYIAAAVIYLPFMGYLVSCIRSVMEQDENIVLPFGNYGKNFVQGIKYILAGLLLMILYTVVIFLIGVVPISLTSLGYVVPGFILMIPAVLLIILSFLVLLILTPALMCIFSKTMKATALCRFVSAAKLIKNNPKQYFIALLIYIGFSIAAGIPDTIASIITFNLAAIVIGSLISALIATYFVFASAYIIAKSVDTTLIEE